MSRYVCAQKEENSWRRQLAANEAALARARIPAGLRMSVLADVAQLMEGNTLGSGDRTSSPGVTVSNDLVCCGEVPFVTYSLVL